MTTLATTLKDAGRRLYARWLRLAPGSQVRVSGQGHTVRWNDARLHRCRISITGTNNLLVIGRGAVLWGTRIELTGRNLICRIGADTRLRGGTCVVTDAHSWLEIGERTTMMGATLVAQGGGGITFGRDCMVAYGTDVRSSDGHSVIDTLTGEAINPAADILIGNHVWLSVHSQVLKGVVIGDQAIVAARAVVTRPVPAGTIVAGNPARPVRAGVTWDRRRPPAAGPNRPSHATLPF